jgi:hypothetical protein
MARGKARWARTSAVAAIGLVLALYVFVAGWPLPWREVCTGDVCETTTRIDWQRVDWGIPPRRIACGIYNPGPGNVIMEPGEVCVTSQGGQEVSRLTYDEVRRRGTVRRVATLAAAVLVIGVTFAAAARTARRRPVAS